MKHLPAVAFFLAVAWVISSFFSALTEEQRLNFEYKLEVSKLEQEK